jgi:DNA-binding GntR family transcriptional regulator
VLERDIETPAQASARLENRVYSYILEEIAQRKLRPDSRLEEERYARACGVSRSPVRLALRRLEAEGIVEIVPGRGATVRSPGAEEVRQVLELRREIEGFIARLAAGRFSEAELAKLRGAIDDPFSFHMAIAEAARHPLATKFLRELLMRTTVYHLFVDSPAIETQQTAADHERLLAALAEGNPEKACEAAQAHVDAMLREHLYAISERFRAAFGRHSTTVTVLTYYDAEQRPCGMTATSVASLSASPPSLIACVNRQAKSRGDILAAGKFGVNVLGLSQEAIAAHCSKPGGDKALQPEWLAKDAEAATPRLRNAIAHMDCTIARVHEEYTHSLIVADVQRVWLGDEQTPLLYSQGAYRSLDRQTEASYDALWERIASAFL